MVKFLNVYISFCKINNSWKRPVQVPVKKVEFPHPIFGLNTNKGQTWKTPVARDTPTDSGEGFQIVLEFTSTDQIFSFPCRAGYPHISHKLKSSQCCGALEACL